MIGVLVKCSNGAFRQSVARRKSGYLSVANAAEPAGASCPHAPIAAGLDKAQIVTNESVRFVERFECPAIKIRQPAIDRAEPDYAVAVFGDAVDAVPRAIGRYIGCDLILKQPEDMIAACAYPKRAPAILVERINVLRRNAIQDGKNGPLAGGIAVQSASTAAGPDGSSVVLEDRRHVAVRQTFSRAKILRPGVLQLKKSAAQPHPEVFFAVFKHADWIRKPLARFFAVRLKSVSAQRRNSSPEADYPQSSFLIANNLSDHVLRQAVALGIDIHSVRADVRDSRVSAGPKRTVFDMRQGVNRMIG